MPLEGSKLRSAPEQTVVPVNIRSSSENEPHRAQCPPPPDPSRPLRDERRTILGKCHWLIIRRPEVIKSLRTFIDVKNVKVPSTVHLVVCEKRKNRRESVAFNCRQHLAWQTSPTRYFGDGLNKREINPTDLQTYSLTLLLFYKQNKTISHQAKGNPTEKVCGVQDKHTRRSSSCHVQHVPDRAADGRRAAAGTKSAAIIYRAEL